MSARPSLDSPSPSPPKSRSSSKRRPLRTRSQSEINETPAQQQHPSLPPGAAEEEQENGRSGRRYVADKVYSASPFPTLESHILRPHVATRGSSPPTAARLSPLGAATPNLYHYHHDSNAMTTTTTQSPVTLDHGSVLRTHDFSFHDNSVLSGFSFASSSSPSSPPPSLPRYDSSARNAGAHTPPSTIRLVTDDTPSTAGAIDALPSISFAAEDEYDSSPIQPLRRGLYVDSPQWSSPPALPQSRDPSTPTPAARSSRPTLRAISSLVSEATAQQTPGSARSANSSGTQVHRRGGATSDDPPDGSYLHFAERRPRRSTSDPEFPSSSPIVRAFYDSSPTENSPQGALPDQRRRDSDAISPDDPHFSFHRNSTGFPALRRYLEAAEASGRSPSLPSEPSSPVDSVPDLRPHRQLPRSHANRWSSLMSLSTIPSHTEGTTAPSSIRVISTEPSNLFDETEMSQLTENTVQSSIRLVSDGRALDPFQDPDVSAVTQDSTVQSSIRLVSPEALQTNYDADTSVLTFQTQPSIRLVQQSPGDSEDGSRYSRSELEDTPTADRSYRHNPASSPAWVSYSSPVQLPHIADEEEQVESAQLTHSSSSKTSPNLSQLGSSESEPGDVSASGSSLNHQEVIYPSNSSHITRMPYRRRSIRQTSSSPFFHGSSGRANLRQSTIGQSPEQTQDEYWSHERQEVQAATSSFHHNPLEPLEPLAETSPTSPASHASMYTDDGYEESTSIQALPVIQPLRFPAASSSINNTPSSIRIPRNRPVDRTSRVQHIRARTLGSMSSNESRTSSAYPIKSPRRSSSPVLPYNYPTPTTPSDRPARPANPTPGVTPLATPAQDRRVRPQAYQPTLPSIGPPASASDIEQVSFPSVVHRPMHYQLPGRVGNRDFSPHLWHGANQTVGRRNAFRPPSVDEINIRFLSGAKARRDLQIACFAFGFLVPLSWITASFLPLPGRGNVDMIPTRGKKWKGKGVIGDLEKVDGYDAFSADEVAGFESARWWRGLNRCLSLLGIGLMLIFIVIGVVTGKGGIQGAVSA